MVSITRFTYWLSLPAKERGSFSMADVKMVDMNRQMTQRILDNLDRSDISLHQVRLE
jgi:hypothetical protein